MSRNINEVVAYDTIKSSMADIDAACERMITLAKNMTATIEENIGAGKPGWNGESANGFLTEWNDFAEVTFPTAKAELERLVNEKMSSWKDNFINAEASVEGVVSGVNKQ